MDFLTDWLTNWLKELLISGIMGRFYREINGKGTGTNEKR